MFSVHKQRVFNLLVELGSFTRLLKVMYADQIQYLVYLTNRNLLISSIGLNNGKCSMQKKIFKDEKDGIIQGKVLNCS